MRSYIIIPARLASTRLPRKLLLRETGKSAEDLPQIAARAGAQLRERLGAGGISGVILLGESLTLSLVAGGLMTIVGVGIIMYWPRVQSCNRALDRRSDRHASTSNVTAVRGRTNQAMAALYSIGGRVMSAATGLRATISGAP